MFYYFSIINTGVSCAQKVTLPSICLLLSEKGDRNHEARRTYLL